MIRGSGLIELDCGWVIGVGAVNSGEVRVVLQYDPKRENPSFGVKDLRLTVDEAEELERALSDARSKASSTEV